MFPYRDNLATGGWPFGVASLVAVLCLVNIPLFLSPEWHNDAVAAGGFIPLLFSSKPFLSSYRLITATALHGDIFHLAGNCLFLVVFGRTLERLFGARLLLLLFPALGVAGFLAEWATDAASPVPVIGASGAIAALMGAYLPLFPGARIRVVFWFWWFWKRFTLPAWAFLLYWMGLQLLSIAMGAWTGKPSARQASPKQPSPSDEAHGAESLGSTGDCGSRRQDLAAAVDRSHLMRFAKTSCAVALVLPHVATAATPVAKAHFAAPRGEHPPTITRASPSSNDSNPRSRLRLRQISVLV